VPTESARNTRKMIRNNNESVSRSAGNSGVLAARPGSGFGQSSGFHQTSSALPMKQSGSHGSALRLDQQSQEHIKNICVQLRNPDFRERIEAIEKFQVACETATELVIANLVQVDMLILF
jgi:hypothetical protein